MRIYIAGPITGIPDYAERFAKAAREIEAAGHVAVNPALDGTGGGKSWHYYARRALFLMLTCDAVLLLDGWLKSRGARFERDVADALNMTTFADLHALELLGDSIAPAALGDVDVEVGWAVRYDDGDLDTTFSEDDARELFVENPPDGEDADEAGYAKNLLRRTVITIRYSWEEVESR